ncbi:molecular chaperone Skp [Rhodospirillum rubrum]|uniref:OmpH family outer membrane protein n=1 Tax=Rhodospirillum rubrum TaxID=1085 RepID=UPI001904DA44|nr:OmpH family outer membrane protein [Rhodospirillum rubrum]MBK1663285.1 molecular chaperone Skp [Rhodospirillum rubrum]MBK1675096.1 molecular chaperone Skp [Rhodospirillum rubrum]
MRFLKGARLLVVAASVALSIPAVQAAEGDSFPNASMGVIDVQQILSEATSAQGARAARDKYLESYSVQARKEEQALHDAQAKLAREADQGSDAFKKKRQDFEKKVNAFQTKFSALRQNLDRAMAQALGQVQDAIINKSNEVAGERGINLVLYRNQVLLFDPRMSMTDEVLKRVNAELPSVTFPDPESLAKKQPAKASK